MLEMSSELSILIQSAAKLDLYDTFRVMLFLGRVKRGILGNILLCYVYGIRNNFTFIQSNSPAIHSKSHRYLYRLANFLGTSTCSCVVW